jgi:seryl-tRNA synthetase
MYDIKWIRDNSELFEAGRSRRGPSPTKSFLCLMMRVVTRSDNFRCRKSDVFLFEEIGIAFKEGDHARAEALKSEVAVIKENWDRLEREEKQAKEDLEAALLELPNMPMDDVPIGFNQHEYRGFSSGVREFSFQLKEHFDLGEKLGLMDFEAAAKISGARFVVNKGQLAQLERALAQFMLDQHIHINGYMEVNPP